MENRDPSSSAKDSSKDSSKEMILSSTISTLQNDKVEPKSLNNGISTLSDFFNSSTSTENIVFAEKTLIAKEIDPCDEFECSTYNVPGPFCIYYKKGLFDSDCFIPCRLENCSTQTEFGIACPKFSCRYLPGPSPIKPTPKPATPSHFELGLGIGLGGKNNLST